MKRTGRAHIPRVVGRVVTAKVSFVLQTIKCYFEFNNLLVTTGEQINLGIQIMEKQYFVKLITILVNNTSILTL